MNRADVLEMRRIAVTVAESHSLTLDDISALRLDRSESRVRAAAMLAQRQAGYSVTGDIAWFWGVVASTAQTAILGAERREARAGA